MYGDRSAVQTDIAEVGRRAVDAFDVQRVDDKPLQPLKTHRIAFVGPVLDVQLANKTSRPLSGQAEPAFRRIGRAAINVQVQPDRAGPRRAPNVHGAVAVRDDLKGPIGDREFARTIVADRRADVVEHHLINDRAALQGQAQPTGVKTDALVLRLGAGQGIVGDLDPPHR